MDVATNSEFVGYDVSNLCPMLLSELAEAASQPMMNAFAHPLFVLQFDPRKKDANNGNPMKCRNNGPWHLGVSKEACENVGTEKCMLWVGFSPCTGMSASQSLNASEHGWLVGGRARRTATRQ